MKISFFSILLSLLIFSTSAYSQFAPSDLDESFLEGLPPSVREQVETANKVNQDEELDRLFRTDTSIEKNKFILQRLKEEINALEQQISLDSNEKVGLERYGSSFFRTLQSSFMPINIPNMAGDYIIDVGDKFEVLISDDKSIEGVMVNRDGSIQIPKLGKIFVAKKKLSEVDSLVKSVAAEKLIGVDVEISLSSLRDMQIVVLGGVESPGIYTISGGSNFLGAINVAGGISENGSFRSIDIRRNGEVIKNIDLYDIFINGNFQNDELLRSGDTVFVNPFQLKVPVTGGVNYEFIFEAKQGDTYSDMINYAGGFSTNFYGYDYVIIKKSSISGTRTEKILTRKLSKI